MSFKLLIASIERTIEMEKVKTQEREMMLASSKTLLYPAGEKLPVLNSPEFMAELNAILPLLRYLNEPLPEWCEVKEGSIDVPDELMPLFNKLGF